MKTRIQPVRGRLIVFEGADGVGKTTLSRYACRALAARGTPTMFYAFPGSLAGTLGELVYRIHHDKRGGHPKRIVPVALQALHIAAHIDAIERIIRPALASGATVVLDRFWWSTWVYGMAAGVRPVVLRKMVDLEESVWGSIKPEVVILIRRKSPLRPEGTNWPLLCSLYDSLARREFSRTRLHRIGNENLAESKAQVLSILGVAP